jgi:oligoribonuclease
MQSETNLAWLDLEMTGLEPEKDAILEIATIVTDSELRVIAEGPLIAVHQDEHTLTLMDSWCRDTHEKSGLTDRVRNSTITALEAQARTLEFIAKYCPQKKVPLCGNTIGQDRRFLAKYMPLLNNFFHYRSVDVSTIKELVGRWYPEKKYAHPKSKQHQALEDIRESIAELNYYRKSVFR